MRSTQALLPGATFDPERLLSPQQARERYAAAVALEPIGRETVPLGMAFGRVLAADAIAAEAFPAQDRSTMDGFAVRSADGAAPRRSVAEIRMGQPPPAPLGPGEAMPIPTGGTLPVGADAVIPLEDTTTDGARLTVRTAPQPHDFFTPAGADMRPGEVALPTGRRIGGPELSVLATLGIVQVPVFRRPCLAIGSTGDELVDAASTPGIQPMKLRCRSGSMSEKTERSM